MGMTGREFALLSSAGIVYRNGITRVFSPSSYTIRRN